MKNSTNKILKKIILTGAGMIAAISPTFAGPPPPPSGVPIDDGLPYLLVGAILMGVYKIKKKMKSKD